VEISLDPAHRKIVLGGRRLRAHIVSTEIMVRPAVMMQGDCRMTKEVDSRKLMVYRPRTAHTLRGISTTRRVPFPGEVSIFNVPPSRRTRSRKLAKPKPEDE
jgi:hypothetical protein